MNNDYDFGNKIYELRKSKGYTQEDIALELGVSYKAVSKWENGSAKPTISNLNKLCNILDVNLEDLFRKEDNKKMTIVNKIVISGGPCAGKTTALKYIKDYFEKEGYLVLFVPAVGSNLIRWGFKSAVFNNYVDCEKMHLKLQIELEDLIDEQVGNLNADKVLIVCDRGAMDIKAYCSAKDFNKTLLDLNLTVEELINRYDAVFLLPTVAKGFKELYQADGNVRLASVQDAVVLDDKAIEAWITHPVLRTVKNYYRIEDKMNNLLKEIKYFLNSNTNTYFEKKYLIDLPNMNVLDKVKSLSRVKLSSTYLKDKDNLKIIKRKVEDSTCFYLVEKNKYGKKNTRISSNKYIKLLDDADPLRKRVDKDRYVFVYKNHVLKIDIFPFWDDKALLEVDLLSPREEIELPKFIHIIEDVSDNKRYSNKNISLIDKTDIM